MAYIATAYKEKEEVGVDLAQVEEPIQYPCLLLALLVSSHTKECVSV